MKIFVYKIIVLMVSLFLLFNFTIGYQIRKIEDKVTNLSSKDKIEEIKIKLKKEIQSGLEKDKIFNEEEKILLRDFLEKIVTELELNKINK